MPLPEYGVGAMKLVNYIESDMGIEVSNDDLDISNFSSVDRIIAYIDEKKGET